MSDRLPKVRFVKGLRLTVLSPAREIQRPIHVYWLIGTLEDSIPFLLNYHEGGVTHWECAARLGDATRRKILARLRTEIRQAAEVPAYLTCIDCTAPGESRDPDNLSQMFHTQTWRAETLGDREEDYVELSVPFEEKDRVKALGAKWDGAKRKWRVRRQPDMSPFERWMGSST